MLCKDCKHSMLILDLETDVSQIVCEKYGVVCDTTNPNNRQCIEEDCDVIWRAAREKGARYDG